MIATMPAAVLIEKPMQTAPMNPITPIAFFI